jgi:tetratricopeptide (TPR) repeat protein
MKHQKSDKSDKLNALKAQAQSLYDSAQFDAAIRAYEDLLTQNLSDTDKQIIYCQLGDAFYATSAWKKASDAYLHALQLNPESIDAALGFGDVAVEAKSFAEAEKAYHYALQLDATQSAHIAHGFKKLGDLLRTDKQIDTATQAYQQALETDKTIIPDLIADYLSQYDQIDTLKQELHTLRTTPQSTVDSSASEENELLLLQLHQVQEELEAFFIKNNELEKQLQTQSQLVRDKEALQEQIKTLEIKYTENKKTVEKLTLERDQQTSNSRSPHANTHTIAKGIAPS